jgi:hypothetical protein
MFDPRTMSMPVHGELKKLSDRYKDSDTPRRKEQKGQAVELYTYLATWGMLRLKAEEQALSQDGKKDVVKAFFHCLETISEAETSSLTGNNGLETLKAMDTDEYLGLTGLGLTIAQEFSFWATAVYTDLKEVD